MPGFGPSAELAAVLTRVESALRSAGIAVADRDLERPWGGFLVISRADLPVFIEAYFPHMGLGDGETRLSPKILLVGPRLRLSWQYHRRRREMWRVLEGPVGISRGATDSEPAMVPHDPGETIRLELGERHRLTGLDDWGVVAEIWQHADPSELSDELDIVRVADDHRRA